MRRILFISLIISSFTAHAGKLKKGFEALEIYNYFEAKRLFEKSIKKHPVPACFGLSVIYARKDNPFYNLDSAYNKIKKSYTHFPLLKEKHQEKYLKKLGIDSALIVQQRDLVSRLYYERARDVNSIYGYQDYIDKNYWSSDVDSARYFRDFLAFEQAKQRGGSADYSFFLAAYPNSHFAQVAQENMDEMLYREQTQNNSFVDYVNFVKSNPNSPYRGEAEDKIYSISTSTGSVESYRNFIVEFPGNQNVTEAWKYLYNARLKEEYSSTNIMAFNNEYPDYPFKQDLLQEYNMADKIFYPIKTSGKWGFCDKNGNLTVNTTYELAEWYSEGLAVIKTDDKFGYINKLGQTVVNPRFDDALPFNEGHALVELDELWGMIDRNGDFIIPAQFEDLGELRDGLVYFQEGDFYGYFDAKGKVRLKPQYSEAFDFENGLAVVSKNDYYGVIDKYGTTSIPFKYEELYSYSEEEYVALLGDYYGVVNLKGDTIVPFEYDFIGKPINGISLVELDDEFNYLNEDGSLILSEWIETYAEYRQLALFKNGYAKVLFEKGFNLIDATGKKLFRTDYGDVGSYSNLIAVKNGEDWGYVNPKGQKVLPFDYSYAHSFEGNTTIVQLSPFYGVIDRKGEFVIDPFQEELRRLNDSLLIAKRMGKFGLISVSGDTLLNYKYIKIEPIDDIVVKLEEEGEVFYYNCQSRQFIRKEE